MTTEREIVMIYSFPGGGERVCAATEVGSVLLHPSPFPGNYETVISVYRIPDKPEYEPGPVPGSLW